MKKLLLVATIAVAGFANAKNTNVIKEMKIEKSIKTFQLCGVHVTYYDSEGTATGTEWFLVDAPTLSSCQAYQSFVMYNLSQYFTITR